MAGALWPWLSVCPGVCWHADAGQDGQERRLRPRQVETGLPCAATHPGWNPDERVWKVRPEGSPNGSLHVVRHRDAVLIARTA